MTTRTVAVRLDDESPLYQALRRYAYERGIMKLSQAATELLTEALIPEDETATETKSEPSLDDIMRCAREAGPGDTPIVWRQD